VKHPFDVRSGHGNYSLLLGCYASDRSDLVLPCLPRPGTVVGREQPVPLGITDLLNQSRAVLYRDHRDMVRLRLSAIAKAPRCNWMCTWLTTPRGDKGKTTACCTKRPRPSGVRLVLILLGDLAGEFCPLLVHESPIVTRSFGMHFCKRQEDVRLEKWMRAKSGTLREARMGDIMVRACR
jgi:hypothetical protein